MAEEDNKVVLNVYDLSQGLARQFSSTLLGKTIDGIWHTGLVVYGNEYFFGGGIQCAPSGKTPYGKPVKVIDLGVTHVPSDLFDEYLREIAPRYTMETYNLFSHNCNNFSNEVAQFLVGISIPDYILQLPNEVLNSPLSPLILPMFQQLETTLKAGAVPQAPQLNPNSASSTFAGQSPSKSNNKKVDTSKEEMPPSGEAMVDPLGSARNMVQDEITREFSELMASGTMRASEAAALATRKVMDRYGSTADMARS